MATEELGGLERFNSLLAQTSTALEQLTSEVEGLAGELQENDDRLRTAAAGLAEVASRAVSETEAAGEVTTALEGIVALATDGLPDGVSTLVESLSGEWLSAVEETDSELREGHAEALQQGLEPAREAVSALDGEARENRDRLVSALEQAFKASTLGQDEVAPAGEALLPKLTGHMQLYAELSSHVDTQMDVLATAVHDGVVVPLGLEDTVDLSAGDSGGGASVGFVAGASLSGGSFDASMVNLGAGGADPSALMSENGAGLIGNDSAGLITDNGAGLFSDQGAGVLANDGASLVTDNGAGLFSDQGAGVLANDGASLIGNDGASLIGNDGASLIGNDGATLVGNDGASLIGNDGGTLVGNDGASLIGNDGGTLVGNDGASLIGNGGSLVGNSGNT